MKTLLACLVLLCTTLAQAGTLPNLLVREGGVRVAGFSSATGGADVDQLLPPRELLEQPGVDLNDFVWCTADNAAFPHWVMFEFRNSQWLTTLVFNNALNDEMAYPGISARQVEVWVGAESRDKLRKVAAFQLERNKNGQSVRIAPVQARWLKFVVTGNWGNPTWTELSAFAAYDDGARPSGLAEALKQQGKVDLYGLYFDFASPHLRAESQPVLEEILRIHRADPRRVLIIEGHTDNQGGRAYNQRLSLQRAQAVVAALARMGAAKSAFDAQGLGAEQPVADNASAAGKAKNRRVTVRFKS
jgi:outer membrane protein OmpA-like peptidoglycan-associated protein